MHNHIKKTAVLLLLGGVLTSCCSAAYGGENPALNEKGGWPIADPLNIVDSFGGGLSCGMNYDCDQITIFGEGEMQDYNGSPWRSSAVFFTDVFIEDGVTSIGSCLCAGMIRLEQVTIPNTVISIHDNAFVGCDALKDVYFGGTEEEWGRIAIGASNEPLFNAEIHFAEEAAVGASAESVAAEGAAAEEAATDSETGSAGMADFRAELTKPTDYKIQFDPSEAGEIYESNYAAYRHVAEQCILQYGDSLCIDAPVTRHFTGLSFLKLVDLEGDGNEELLLVFCVRKQDPSYNYDQFVYVFNIWGYDGEKAVLLIDGENLYVGNGGTQTVKIIKNEFGSFLLKGGADSFEYDYYYGRTGESYGIAKEMLYEEGSPGQHCWIDGEPVSEDIYQQEKQLWGDTWIDGAQCEYYSLTPFSTEEENRTMDQINETLAVLGS